MFIVEGVDKVGKSTLIQEVLRQVTRRGFAAKYGPRYVSAQRFGLLSEIWNYLTDYTWAIQQAEICDRFTLSELAYGPVFRGAVNPRFTPHARRVVARELNLLGSSTVCLLTEDWELISRRLEACGGDELLKRKQQFDRLNRAFERALLGDLALGRSGLDCVHQFDVTVLDEEDQVARRHVIRDLVAQLVEHWELNILRSREVLEVTHESHGSLYPQVILVGERVGHGVGTRPFTATTGCSPFLSRLLDEALIPEGTVHTLNALDEAGQPLRGKILDVLLSPIQELNLPHAIIGLGNVAHEVLQGLGVKYMGLPHPQFIKRFHYHRREEWVKKLRDAWTLIQESTRERLIKIKERDYLPCKFRTDHELFNLGALGKRKES